jgi:chlorobactene glucosyltransferase
MSMTLQLAICAALSFMGLILLVNMAALRTLRRGMRPGALPQVSVLVPARNEEKNIGPCIAGLLKQHYPNYEILVLDDNSGDGTAAIVQAWERRNSRVRYVKGQPLPSGWVGKNFACHQLSREAEGDLLLFVDADTRHSPESIISAVTVLEARKADLVTVFPDEIMATFWEKTVLPLLHFSLMCFLPLPLVSGSRNHRFAMANGQFMLFRRSAYDAIGGHAAVKDALVEDIWLSRVVKQHGFKVSVVDGSRVVSCRMYTSLREIWAGFSKNLFAGFKFSLPTMIAVLMFNAATSILPFISLAGIALGEMPGGLLPVVGAQIGILLVIRLLVAARFGLNLASAFLHPVAMAIVIGMSMNSARWILAGGGSQWKGRAYQYRNQALAAMKGGQ